MRPARALVVLTGLSMGAGVAAASALVGGDPPDRGPDHLQPGPAESLAGPRAQARPGTPVWGVRTYISRRGWLCAERGRVQGGIFGDLDAGGEFRARPTGPTGTCADPDLDPVVAVVDRIAASGDEPAGTIVFGASLRRPRAVRVTPDGEPPVELEVGARGSFIGAFEGLRDPSTLSLSVDLPGGGSYELRW